MSALLGGMTAAAFLRRHWQRRPLLVRQALPGFSGLVDREAMLALAARADVTSRLVVDRGTRRDRWERHDGPLAGLDAAALPPRGWTLLVNALERLVPGGWELLGRFDFLPAARVDDLMVSHAAPGGSVGPHVDAYDVFLLQGPGRRRWQIAAGGDRRTDPDAAIRVLADFRPEAEWVLEPGDLLYLPPGVAHHGVAVDACSTYSIGFSAPSERELLEGFLGYLAGVTPADPEARYADPPLQPVRDALLLPPSMIDHARRVLGRARWDDRRVEDFLGCFLTRPRPRQIFDAPRRPVDEDRFARRLRAPGRLRLALGTRGLWRGDRAYVNGEAQRVAAAGRPTVRALLGQRSVELPRRLDAATRATLYAWYLSGWLERP